MAETKGNAPSVTLRFRHFPGRKVTPKTGTPSKLPQWTAKDASKAGRVGIPGRGSFYPGSGFPFLRAEQNAQVILSV